MTCIGSVEKLRAAGLTPRDSGGGNADRRTGGAVLDAGGERVFR